MSHRISIAMATWNGEQHLPAQLESFLTQTVLPDELVVRDDGSSDRTLQILQRFADRAPFEVRILESGPRLGYATNFERALTAVTGDLIFLSDQDDAWFPERVEVIRNASRTHPDIQLFINDIENVGESLERSGVTKLANLRRAGLPEEHYVTGCATALRRPLLTFALPFPPGLAAHDKWLHECAHWLGVRSIIPQVLQLYRRHGQNASNFGISRPQHTGRLRIYLQTLSGNARYSLGQQLLVLEALAIRLKQHRALATDIAGVRVDAASIRIETRIAALHARLEVLATSRPQRIGKACQHYLSGGYDEFLGWKTLIRDLLD
ncbi:glycosyltransferase [Azoarcus communis]|uniref:glycosyltransferase n=1 Tax=Parazoarcus communis TaxID=41977 RepID=UPI0014592C3B|nr:glycosyltransferase [Parazoarcus communis]NMG47474.1 glycosyltransferase [Parazoarcus communis]